MAAYIKILIFLFWEIQTAIHLILPGELLKSLWIPSLLLSSPAQVPHSLVNYKIMFEMSLHNKGSGKQTFSMSFQVPCSIGPLTIYMFFLIHPRLCTYFNLWTVTLHL